MHKNIAIERVRVLGSISVLIQTWADKRGGFEKECTDAVLTATTLFEGIDNGADLQTLSEPKADLATKKESLLDKLDGLVLKLKEFHADVLCATTVF